MQAHACILSRLVNPTTQGRSRLTRSERVACCSALQHHFIPFFNARSFIHEDLSGQKTHSPRGKGTVESCTLCVHRVDEDRAPACVEACADAGHHALVFGDLNDAQGPLASAVAREETEELRSDLKLNTAVRYSGI